MSSFQEYLKVWDAHVLPFKLEAHSNKPLNIVRRLDCIYTNGKEKKKQKVLHQAYIYFRRWMVCVQWLKRQKVDKFVVENHYPEKRVEEIKKHISDVYLMMKDEWELAHPPEKEITDGSKQNVNDVDLSLQLPETPNDEPQPKDEYTCTDLYKLANRAKARGKFIVIDVRQEQEYSECRLNIDDSIHFPAENVQPNKPQDYYEDLLRDDNQAVKRFRNLEKFEIIILLDYNSSADTMPSNGAIAIFKKCLQDWNLMGKRQIVILKGGFLEWKQKYPKCVVNTPANKFLDGLDLSPDIMGDTITSQKPAVQNAYVPSPILSSGKRSMITKPVRFGSTFADPPTKSTNKINNAMLLPDMPLAPGYDITSTMYQQPVTQLNGYYPQQNGYNDIYNSITSVNYTDPKSVIEPVKKPIIDRSSKPIVDRSSKPASGKRISNEVMQLEAELEQVMKNIEPYMRKIRCNVKLGEWDIEQLDTYRKKEKELREKIHEIEQKQHNKLYPDLPTSVFPVAVTRKMTLLQPTQPTAPSQQPVAIQPPAVQPAGYKPSLSENKENSLQEPRVRLQRMSIDPPPLRMEIDDDDDVENHAAAASIRKEPLKSSDGQATPVPKNSSLKRSYSSPNLAKDQKLMPEVPDRSLKPKVDDSPEEMRRHSFISSKDREQRMEPVWASIDAHPGVTGLKNLGNSCYMNSIIQCLSNTVYLANYFNTNDYTNDLNSSNKPHHKSVADEVAQVIRALWRGTYKSISPRDLRSAVGDYKRQFQSYDQQDSHEFLTFLLDWMHNDLKKPSKVTYNGRSLTTMEKEWDKQMNNQSSIISNLFFGMLRSTIECCTCKKISTTYETFNSLTVSLTSKDRCSLDECFEKYLQSQRVTGWKCPNCKVTRDGMKKFDLAKLPPIVVIHLNRFGDSGGWLAKKNTSVDFPLLNFNLKKYLVEDNETFNSTPNASYNLYAISNHYGTMEGGHYTAYCKSAAQQKWYKYDDHTVTETLTCQVRNQSSSAYLLFYALSTAETYLNS